MANLINHISRLAAHFKYIAPNKVFSTLWREYRDLLITAFIYITVGFLFAIILPIWGFGAESETKSAYGRPLLHLFQAFFFLTEEETAKAVFNSCFTFVSLYFLSAAFIASFKSGYISLGVEGAAILSLLTLIVVVNITSNTPSIYSPFLILSFGLSAVFLTLVFFLLKFLNFEKEVDDVTPGIVVNVISVTVAAAVLALTNLLHPSDTGISSTIAANALRDTSSESALSGWAFGFVFSTVLLAGFSYWFFNKSEVGLSLRARGQNRKASKLIGLDNKTLSLALGLYVGFVISIVSVFHFMVQGQIEVELLSNRIIDIIAIALISRLNYFALIFGVLTMMGISEIGIFVQLDGMNANAVFAIKGLFIIVFASFLPGIQERGND